MKTLLEVCSLQLPIKKYKNEKNRTSSFRRAERNFLNQNHLLRITVQGSTQYHGSDFSSVPTPSAPKRHQHRAIKNGQYGAGFKNGAATSPTWSPRPWMRWWRPGCRGECARPRRRKYLLLNTSSGNPAGTSPTFTPRLLQAFDFLLGSNANNGSCYFF